MNPEQVEQVDTYIEQLITAMTRKKWKSRGPWRLREMVKAAWRIEAFARWGKDLD